MPELDPKAVKYSADFTIDGECCMDASVKSTGPEREWREGFATIDIKNDGFGATKILSWLSHGTEDGTVLADARHHNTSLRLELHGNVEVCNFVGLAYMIYEELTRAGYNANIPSWCVYHVLRKPLDDDECEWQLCFAGMSSYCSLGGAETTMHEDLVSEALGDNYDANKYVYRTELVHPDLALKDARDQLGFTHRMYGPKLFSHPEHQSDK